MKISSITRKEVAGVYLYQWIGWLITIGVILAAAYLKVDLPPLPAVP